METIVDGPRAGEIAPPSSNEQFGHELRKKLNNAPWKLLRPAEPLAWMDFCHQHVLLVDGVPSALLSVRGGGTTLWYMDAGETKASRALLLKINQVENIPVEGTVVSCSVLRSNREAVFTAEKVQGRLIPVELTKCSVCFSELPIQFMTNRSCPYCGQLFRSHHTSPAVVMDIWSRKAVIQNSRDGYFSPADLNRLKISVDYVVLWIT